MCPWVQKVYQRVPEVYQRVPKVYTMVPEMHPRFSEVYPRVPEVYQRFPEVYPSVPMYNSILQRACATLGCGRQNIVATINIDFFSLSPFA